MSQAQAAQRDAQQPHVRGKTLNGAKRRRFTASSHIGPRRLPTWPLYTRVGQSCLEQKSIIMLLPKLTCPSCVTWLLVRLPTCLSCHIQVPLPYPRKPPAWPQANNISRGAAAKCGVERAERSGANDRGPTFCLRRPLSAGASGGKRPPGAEGPPEGKKRERSGPIVSAAKSSYLVFKHS